MVMYSPMVVQRMAYPKNVHLFFAFSREKETTLIENNKTFRNLELRTVSFYIEQSLLLK